MIFVLFTYYLITQFILKIDLNVNICYFLQTCVKKISQAYSMNISRSISL